MISGIELSVRMFSPMSQIFRKNGGGNPPVEPAGNEDLECGRGSSAPQNPTASGYQSSPSRVYLPQIQSIHASKVPQTPTASREFISHIQHNGQYGSATGVPLMPSEPLPVTPGGSLRVVGYLPRTIYSDSPTFVNPTRLIMPSQPSQNTSNRDFMSDSGPRCRSTSISRIPSHRSPSPESPFDPSKHGQALRRLETHGSLKTIPFCEQEVDALNRKSISWSEIGPGCFEEDRTAESSVSPSHPQESRNLADPYDKADQRSGTDNSSRLTQCLPNSIYEPEVLRQADSGRVIELHEPLKDEDGHGLSIHTPVLEEIDEYLWSPAPSDDGQEAQPESHMPVLRHVPLGALRATPISGPISDSSGGFAGSSEPYDNDQMRAWSGSSIYPGVIDSPLPHIDVLIPAGDFDLDSHSTPLISSQHASNTGSRESSSVLFRYSGVITDGASARPMSETELKEEVIHSLGSRAKTGSSMLNSKNSSSQADRRIDLEQFCGEHDPNARPEACPRVRVHSPPADAGPGSSQTSSSLSTGHYNSDPSSHKAHPGPSPRIRCPTPPLLFGRYAISAPKESKAVSRPGLGRTISRFDQLAETGHLPTPLRSLGEQDWETVSAETEAATHAFSENAFNMKTGSSLADNSDSGSLSLSKETSYPLRGARSLMLHPAHPRHNHSYMLLKNSQTGDLVQVPQYEYPYGGRLPNNNTSAHLVSRVRADSTYQHPSPLRIHHSHPFTSSPPVTRFEISESSSSGLSAGVSEVKEKQTQNSLYKTNQNLSRVPDPAVDQFQYMVDSKEQSHQSSAWLSTVSEVASSEPSLPRNGATFPNVVTRDGKGHVNVTPERGLNREVGSSLADASSPGIDFSSSPAPLSRSPIQFSDTPPYLDHGNKDLLGNFHKSLARPFNREDTATSVTHTENRSRSHSASGPQVKDRKPSPRRRRSSSESDSRLMDSPSARKASALKVSSSDGHAQQTASSGLLLRNPFSHADDNESQYHSSQRDFIEQKLRHPKADDASVDDPITPSSTETGPFRTHDLTVYTDTPPPIFNHPVYGRERPWDRVRPTRPNPLRRPLNPRPIARAESPHLHRIPQPPTAEVLERHVLLSQVYLILLVFLPPVAIIYGHGYMDGIMRFHTAGEIDGFRNTEKTVALYLGYGVSALCIGAVIAVIIIMAFK